jgi:hypothetical protein
MTRISFRSLATRAVLVAGMIGVLAAPLPALARDRNWQDWHRPHPVYVAPTPVYGPPAYAAPYPAPYAAPAYPAPAVYRSCNNALVGGLIGAAAGTLIGAGAGSHSRDGGAAAIMGLLGGAAVGTAVGAASCN